jgi:hypothetical protein
MMMTTEQVRALFDYRDGQLWWRERQNPRIDLAKPAGSVVAGRYRIIKIGAAKHQAHRLVWLWHGRDLPEHPFVLDHVNRVKDDNAIENLRVADQSSNQFNKDLTDTNRSGIKGVSWCTTYKKWVVQVYAYGRKCSGRFETLEEAAAFSAQKRAEMHGQFAHQGA